MSQQEFEFAGIWEMEYRFEAFIGLQSRRGDYCSISDEGPSDGMVSLSIQDELTTDYNPKVSQLNSIEYLSKNYAAIREAIIDNLIIYYESRKEEIGIDPEEEDFADYFPIISSRDDYNNVFGIGNVFIFTEEKDDYAYVGLEGGCTWDGEHGIGFLLHKDRVIKVGDADCSTDYQSAYKDNGTFEQKEKDQYLKSENPPKPIFYKPHPKFGTLKPNQIRSNKMYPNKLIETGWNREFIELVENGELDINNNSEMHVTYLHNAITSNNIELSKYIFGLSPLQTSGLIQATAGKMNIELVKICLENGLDINEISKINDTLFTRVKNSIEYYRDRDPIKYSKTKEFMKFIKSKGAKE